MTLNHFIGKSQMSAINSALKGEEKEFFRKMLDELLEKFNKMPKSYETDGMGKKAPIALHYFKGGSDWYIIEKDMEQEQFQAFGFAILNGDLYNAELGYINIEELISLDVELDLYYKPETIGELKKRLKGGETT